MLIEDIYSLGVQLCLEQWASWSLVGLDLVEEISRTDQGMLIGWKDKMGTVEETMGRQKGYILKFTCGIS